MPPIGGLGQRQEPELEDVADRQLRHRDTISSGDLRDVLVLHQLPVRDRRVRLHEDALLLRVLDQLEGRVADVRQDLIDHGLDGAGRQDVVEVGLREVGHADGAELTRRIGLLEGLPRFAVALEVAVVAAELRPRLRAVDDHHVDVVEPHPLKRPVDGRDRLLVRLHLRGQLRGHEHVFPGHAAGTDSFPDAALVGVGLGGVDVAIADLQRVPDGLFDLLVADHPGTEPQLGNLHAVGERVRLVQNHDRSLLAVRWCQPRLGSAPYCSSVTFSIQSTAFPSSDSWMAA